MKYTNPVYRPPFEADSLLLQVTVGCSHNQCSFCTMYQDVPFQTESMEQIEKDLVEARKTYPKVNRIFLVNADPFVLSANKLKLIATKINEILPEVKTIAMYASIKNIINKTDEELKELRALKINELNIGVESAMPEVVEHFNKGFTIEEAKVQLNRLTNAGIDFSLNIIIGAAGSEKSYDNAIANSKFLNEIKPYLIFIATLHIDEGSPLEEELKKGTFKENTLRQNVEEEILMLSGLDLNGSYFYGRHVSNIIPVYGMLPEKKEEMLTTLKNGLSSVKAEYLDAHLKKGSEGNIISILR
ncbi:radical SAM protein [Desulforamulus aeronauticus]|uniref:Radical SAM superfamily protein n=1 Tax=Desulforamulus aeronauticus DSM 10349 TaxID=1121421 RepID=A0A1M6P3N0_9FIRM|nr:radical SAM protein [Desulforamulus aeronauticus]SHK02520.1 Radical SAM superfamily protein [Desulforamulus aeronauticus DSM 10349]